MVAWMFGETAVGDANALAFLIETSLQPNVIAEWVDDALVNVPTEHLHEAVDVFTHRLIVARTAIIGPPSTSQNGIPRLASS